VDHCPKGIYKSFSGDSKGAVFQKCPFGRRRQRIGVLKMKENVRNALRLLLSRDNGILSTHSIDVPGYPFGSLTPYCLDHRFNPVILISNIAQHTKNINANPKVCLTVSEETGDSEKQAFGRYTYIGDVEWLERDSDDFQSVSSRYFRYFPSSRNYLTAHDFNFCRIKLVRGRYIGGFGEIFWLEKKQLKVVNPFAETEEQMIINHMNDEHFDSLINYCSHYKNIQVEKDDPLFMVGVCQFGFDLLWKGRRLFFPFEKEARDVMEVRERMVHMSKESRK
jgi:hypothetical protein